MPVSSSGHLVLVPELLGWPYAGLDPELRKSFEVALHAGTAAALLWALRHEVAEVIGDMSGRRAIHVAATFAPAAIAGLRWERPIERRLGSARSVAAAQVVAGLALWAADRAPASRRADRATTLDHLLVGIGQAAALVPGVSRNGATLTAARLRGFRRRDANRISRRAALPVIVGATALKGVRLAKRGLPPGIALPFAAGAGAAFVSTLACSPLVAAADRAPSYAPFAAYRIVLGTVALVAGARRRARSPSTGPCASIPA
jgi:undecaprenyl-diphosphatase